MKTDRDEPSVRKTSVTASQQVLSSSDGSAKKHPWFSLPSNAYWLMLLLASVEWWTIAGNGRRESSILFAAASLAAFMVGTMAAFLFSSYGEELSTFGKIRDWIIAGITGATFAEVAEHGGIIKQILYKFAPGSGRGDFGLVISMAIVYFGLGFFYMFLQRELLLNVLLAKSRAERGRLDGTVQASLAIQKVLAKLPPSLLTGIDDAGGVLDAEEAAELRSLLEDEDVTIFLSQAEDAIRNGNWLDWDSVSKVAYLYYYRVYFVSDDKKEATTQKALQWLQRALVFNPLHVDLMMKYSDMLGVDEQRESAVVLLEQMLHRDDAPFYVNQWLGYALLWMDDRLEDSIKYSQTFLRQFPDSDESEFNIACAFAQLYCKELKTKHETSIPDSDNRKNALEHLEKALEMDPDYKETVRETYSKKGKDFECLDSDPDYRTIVGLGTNS